MRDSLNTLIGKKNLVGAEIGVAGGKNSEDILRNLDIQKLYLVDPYELYTTEKFIGVPKDVVSLRQKAYKLLTPYSKKLAWVHVMSHKAYKFIDEMLDFVYIDANHTYEYVKADIIVYRALVKDGGLVAGHDYGNEVKRAVDKLVPKDKLKVKKQDWWYTK